MLAVVSGSPASTVLALNSGSSSLKFGLYRVCAARTETMFSESIAAAEPGQAFVRIAAHLAGSGLRAPAAIGHRIVHGGSRLRRHCLIDAAVLRQLEAASAFAPLHTPAALALIDLARKHFPGTPQVACFDTAFHSKMPDVARVLPIPLEWRAEGIERYGFHGLSCESIVHQLAGELPTRLVIAHLGNGASITAVLHGRSIDTSMGLTPSGGVMGTRSGDIDPGVLVWLMRERKFDAARLEVLVDHRSGLLGISGFSGDMRRLHEAASSNPEARLAVAMFCYSVCKQIAGMIAALGGADMLVFTGGIGENDAEVRAAVCARLACVGIGLDEGCDDGAGDAIADAAPRCAVRVLASQEDEQIARHASTLACVS